MGGGPEAPIGRLLPGGSRWPGGGCREGLAPKPRRRKEIRLGRQADWRIRRTTTSVAEPADSWKAFMKASSTGSKSRQSPVPSLAEAATGTYACRAFFLGAAEKAFWRNWGAIGRVGQELVGGD